jgi:hypothetical protein
MIHRSIIDATGELLKTMRCGTQETLALNTPPGCTDVDPCPDALDAWWNGSQWVAKGDRPGPWAVWDAQGKQWVDPRDLASLKAAHWIGIKAERDQREYGTFTWDGSEFDCNRDSTAKIMGAVQTAMLSAQAGQSFSVDWTLADNTVRVMSGVDMISAGMTLMAAVSNLYETSRTLRAQIDAATTAEEVQAITWPAGT